MKRGTSDALFSVVVVGLGVLYGVAFMFGLDHLWPGPAILHVAIYSLCMLFVPFGGAVVMSVIVFFGLWRGLEWHWVAAVLATLPALMVFPALVAVLLDVFRSVSRRA